jgi:hypothetical protein
MDYREIPVESLLLNPMNPRLGDEVEGQQEVINAFLQDKMRSQQLLRLAKDIAEHGPSPIDLALVVPEDGVYTVVEGNRRVLAMKLLKNPALARGSRIEKAIQEASRRSVTLGDMRCMVAPSHEEARHWLVLRHTESQGVGVVRWSPEMQVRYSQNYSGQRGQAIRLTDSLREAYPNDQELHDLIRQVRTTNLTTFGRLTRDPAFRAEAGIDLSGGEVTSQYPPSALRDFWRRVLSDLTTTVTARSLNTKEQRASYVDTLADVRPPSEARRSRAPLAAEPQPGTSGAVAAAPPRRPTRVQRQRPARLFQGLTLRSVSLKARDILREAQQIDLTKLPNAGAVLIRVLVELVVDEAVEYFQLSVPDRLRERIQACLHKLDPTNREDKYAPVRTAVNDPNSLLGVRSMHAYLHNPYVHPDATSLRALSENYVPLLAGLDAAIGSGQQP